MSKFKRRIPTRPSGIFMLLLTTMLLVSICPTWATSTVEDDTVLPLEIDNSGGVETVKGPRSDITDFSQYTEIIIPDTVAAISEGAFYGLSSIQHVTIPHSVTAIEPYAFCLCTGLQEITIPGTVSVIGTHAFESCYALQSVKILYGVKTIDNYAFYSCPDLETIEIAPNADISTNSTVSQVFGPFDEENPVTIYSTSEKIKAYASDHPEEMEYSSEYLPTSEVVYEYDYTPPDADSGTPDSIAITRYHGSSTEPIIPATLGGTPVTAIGGKIIDGTITVRGAFEDFIELTEVTLPKSVKTIDENAFSGCTSLTTIDLSDVTTIDKGAFKASGLTSVTLSDNLASIGNSAFAETKLTEVTLPSALNSPGHLGESVFMDCKELTTVELNIDDIPENTFNGCTKLETVTFNNTITIDKSAFSGCTSLAEIDLSKIESIGDSAFENTGFSTLTLPDTWTSISDSAFKNCANLTAITFPDTLEEIGVSAFAGTGLNTVTLPKSVNSVKKGAFQNCKALTDVIVLNNDTDIGDDAFACDTSRSPKLKLWGYKNSKAKDHATGKEDYIDFCDQNSTEEHTITLTSEAHKYLKILINGEAIEPLAKEINETVDGTTVTKTIYTLQAVWNTPITVQMRKLDDRDERNEDNMNQALKLDKITLVAVDANDSTGDDVKTGSFVSGTLDNDSNPTKSTIVKDIHLIMADAAQARYEENDPHPEEKWVFFFDMPEANVDISVSCVRIFDPMEVPKKPDTSDPPAWVPSLEATPSVPSVDASNTDIPFGDTVPAVTSQGWSGDHNASAAPWDGGNLPDEYEHPSDESQYPSYDDVSEAFVLPELPVCPAREESPFGCGVEAEAVAGHENLYPDALSGEEDLCFEPEWAESEREETMQNGVLMDLCEDSWPE